VSELAWLPDASLHALLEHAAAYLQAKDVGAAMRLLEAENCSTRPLPAHCSAWQYRGR